MSSAAVNLYQLPLEQLQGLKEQLDSDLRTLGAAYDGLFGGRTRYLDNHDAIEQYRQFVSAAEASGASQEVLVCMTSSLFVKGTMIPSDKVLVDVGTGYFLEQSTEHAKNYFNSRAAQVKESMDSIEKTIVMKQQQQNRVLDAMKRKAIAMQQYQQQQQQSE